MTDLPGQSNSPDAPSGQPIHKRRPRYKGKNPRRFEEKYKELAPTQNPDTIARVIASGKTPAGTHRPIMVQEILDALQPSPGETAADCTLGYGGHAEALLGRILPGGFLLGLDQDPIELPKTETRLREKGFNPEVFRAVRTNFAGLPRALAEAGLKGVDLVLADLGVSSMQLDDPRRGFSLKVEGPLDLRMNPARGQPANALLAAVDPAILGKALAENDEPFAAILAQKLAGQRFQKTTELAEAVRKALPSSRTDDRELSVRRVFQALRIMVNDELNVLESLMRQLPLVLNPGGRAAILTFHSGEDRRVKHAFLDGLRTGVYSMIAQEPIRPGAEERHSNPRSAPAKLRWAKMA